jgi:FKBP-type peptidyl-prolyl cis-trans isomerase SlyD
MKIGGEKRVKVKPEDAYGPVDPTAIHEFPKEEIPASGLKVGAVLVARGPEGQPIPVTVKEIKDNTVVLDFNHPLAGKTLIFNIKVLDIVSAPPGGGPPSRSACDVRYQPYC